MLPTLLSNRIDILTKLQNFLENPNDEWEAVLYSAYQQNNWFTKENIEQSIKNISDNYLDRNKLIKWISEYPNLLIGKDNSHITVGLVMAGNIPLVGFQDFLCLFIGGFSMKIKLSSKDTLLWQFILNKIQELNSTPQSIVIADMLKNCDAYIATGSNNTSRYFESYFGKYPNIIRKNRTSVAILKGDESLDDLKNLYQDISQYFGLGCRNVTKLYVPQNYNFEPLLKLFDEDDSLTQHNKYKNNYDYYLAIYLLNKVKHFTSQNVLLLENSDFFAPVATIYYEYYEPNALNDLLQQLEENVNIQTIVCKEENNRYSKIVTMGASQKPKLNQYADGIDTLKFLENLQN